VEHLFSVTMKRYAVALKVGNLICLATVKILKIYYYFHYQ